MCHHAGALFLGHASAEALGDYGAGPNHTLPTSGRARASGGLSVFDFIRIRTWLELENPDQDLITDTATLARSEGLEAHARRRQEWFFMVYAKRSDCTSPDNSNCQAELVVGCLLLYIPNGLVSSRISSFHQSVVSPVIWR